VCPCSMQCWAHSINSQLDIVDKQVVACSSNDCDTRTACYACNSTIDSCLMQQQWGAAQRNSSRCTTLRLEDGSSITSDVIRKLRASTIDMHDTHGFADGCGLTAECVQPRFTLRVICCFCNVSVNSFELYVARRCAGQSVPD
jgi:hypothetical protein